MFLRDFVNVFRHIVNKPHTVIFQKTLNLHIYYHENLKPHGAQIRRECDKQRSHNKWSMLTAIRFRVIFLLISYMKT
jgi:hypothetical protein